MTRTYCICSDLPPESTVWAHVAQRYDTARRSLDGLQVVLKWPATSPTPDGLPADAVLYTHAEVLAVLAGPEWTPPEPELP
jgi:hypothetical protein